MTDADNELEQIRRTYSRREVELVGQDKYSLGNKAYLYTIQQRQRAILRALRQEGLLPLGDKRILEVGSGAGGVLLELLSYGASPELLYGTDLLAERVAIARQLLPHVALSSSDGRYLPYPSRSFDLLLQFTMFSSITDEAICYTVAREMLRVTKPGGVILWYDFWTNPLNKATRGIRANEIRKYFPNCRFDFQRVTLAPPLTRRLVPVSWMGAELLEKLRILNTHYLVSIRPVS
ncbi:MAG: class I SAM-dependent methyltransferase [Chloroflexota bacterium]